MGRRAPYYRDVGEKLDGARRTFGWSGPIWVFPGTRYVSYEGFMDIDIADIADMGSAGSLEVIVMHEMGNVIGLG